MTAGRPPLWPKRWRDLAEKCGGSAGLRALLGYSSKTTLSDKIHGRTPWVRSDLLLLQILAGQHAVPVADLLPASVIAHLSSPGARPLRGAAPSLSEP